MIEERELVAFHGHPNGDQTHNPGICPDPELNPQPFGIWVDNHLARAEMGSLLKRYTVWKFSKSREFLPLGR